MVAVYATSAVGVFSTLYLNLYRTSFQEYVVESTPSNVEKLFFPLAEVSKIQWIENGKEFQWNDKLYDISKIEQTKKGLEIYCVNDDLEERFIALVDQWKKSSPPGSKSKVIFQPHFCNRLGFENGERSAIAKNEFLFKLSPYSPPASRTPSPPPRPHS